MIQESDRSTGPSARLLPWAVAAALVLVGVPLALSSLRAGAPQETGPGILGVTKVAEGAATVELTPTKLEDGRLFVDVGINTHTVNDLDRYDLTAITTLTYGDEDVAPMSAPKLAGHHNRGEMIFPMETLPDGFTIRIRGLDTPAERVFTWP